MNLKEFRRREQEILITELIKRQPIITVQSLTAEDVAQQAYEEALREGRFSEQGAADYAAACASIYKKRRMLTPDYNLDLK